MSRCSYSGGRKSGWGRFFWRKRSLSAAFRHPVLASVWGQALALDCIQRFKEVGGAEGVSERRRCLVQAREATQHLGFASSALAVQAVEEFESGMTYQYLRTMGLLIESATVESSASIGSNRRPVERPHQRRTKRETAGSYSRWPRHAPAALAGVVRLGLRALSKSIASLHNVGPWPSLMQHDVQDLLPQSSRLAAVAQARCPGPFATPPAYPPRARGPLLGLIVRVAPWR